MKYTVEDSLGDYPNKDISAEIKIRTNNFSLGTDTIKALLDNDVLDEFFDEGIRYNFSFVEKAERVDVKFTIPQEELPKVEELIKKAEAHACKIASEFKIVQRMFNACRALEK